MFLNIALGLIIVPVLVVVFLCILLPFVVVSIYKTNKIYKKELKEKINNRYD